LISSCKAKQLDLENVSAEVTNEVDLIFRKYIVAVNYLQPNAKQQLVQQEH
jgi:hypothetical protein